MPTPPKMVAKQAKKAADELWKTIDLLGPKLEPEELAQFTETFNMLSQVVAHHGGPAWNATDEQWEY